jgi:hypothetical protein
MKQVPIAGPTVLDATKNKMVAWATWRPGFVHP